MSLWQASAWPDAAAAMAQALAQATRASAPPPGRASVGGRGVLARCGPLAWWLLDGPRPSQPRDLGTIVDLSSAYVRIDVRGAQAAALLGRLVAIDLRDAAFPTGAFAMTGDAHAALALRRLDADGYEVYVPRSFADHVKEFLMRHARQFGATQP